MIKQRNDSEKNAHILQSSHYLLRFRLSECVCIFCASFNNFAIESRNVIIVIILFSCACVCASLSVLVPEIVIFF